MKKILLVFACLCLTLLFTDTAFGKCNVYWKYKRISDNVYLTPVHDSVVLYQGDKLEFSFSVSGFSCPSCLLITRWYKNGNLTQEGGSGIVINSSGYYFMSNDCGGSARVNVIMIPEPGSPPEATVSISLNSVCMFGSIQLYGIAINYESISWITSGSGTFNDPTIAEPSYFPAVSDADLPFITLTMYVHNPGFQNAAASVQVSVINTFPYDYSLEGMTSVEPHCTGVIYSTSNYPTASYLWTAIGGDITNGQGTSQIMVNWGDEGTGIIMLKGYLDGCAGAEKIFQIVIKKIPPENSFYPFSNLPSGVDVYTLRYILLNSFGEIIDEGKSDGEAILRRKNISPSLKPGLYFVRYYDGATNKQVLTDKVFIAEDK